MQGGGQSELAARGAHAFPKSLRLRKRPDFVRVQRSRVRFQERDLIAAVAPGEEGRVRFGLTVSKKVGNAVVRNRTKRHLREAIRRYPELRLNGVDVVFIARSSAATASPEVLRSQVVSILTRLRDRGHGAPRASRRTRR